MTKRVRIQVRLGWSQSPATDVAGYRVYRDGIGTPMATLNKDATSLVVSIPLQSRSATAFYVTAYDLAGNESLKRRIETVYVVA
jgi:hypothetical protein